MRSDLCGSAPHDWNERAIEDVCSRVTSGGTPSRTEPSYYRDGVWGWVKTQELGDSWIERTEETITDRAVAESSAKVLPANTVLMAMYGATVGQLGLLRRPMTCNQACCALIVDPAAADYRFVFYQLLTSRHQLRRLAVGAAQQNLSGAAVRRIRFPYPSISEQRAIAHILGTLDDKIDLNRQMSATLEAMARALFESWFVRFDPVHAKAEGRDTGLPADIAALFPDSFEQSEIGEVPKGWRVAALDTLAQFLNGLALQRFPASDVAQSLPVIKISQLTKGDTVGADRCSSDVPPEYVVQDGDILFSWSGSLVLTRWTGGVGALNQHLFKVTPTDCPAWFIFEAVRSHLPEFQRIAAGKATTMGHIQRHHLSDANVVLPSSNHLRFLGASLDTIFERALRARLQSRALTSLRDTLLPKLISGELRVPDADRALAGAGVS